MARKNPLGKLVDTAVDALKNPVGTAGKVVDQARGTASLGKLAAEQVTKAAASTALGAAGAVAERAGVRRPSARTGETEPTSPADLRPVPSVNEPAHPPVEKRTEPARVASTTARKAPAKKADGSAPTGKKAAATKAPATKAPAPKAPAKKAPAKKAPAKKTAKSTTDRVRPAAPEPKAVPDRRAAEPASGRQEQALSPNPEEVAKKAAAKGAAANEAPAKRVAASKTVKPAPAKKAPAKKGAAKKTAKKSAAKVAESRDVSPVAEDETVWSTSTPGDKLPAGRGKRNEADPEVPVTKEDLEAAREATPADVAERVEGD
ncbi:MAG: hypothetical protein ACTHOK_02000 [Nocardioidaceae bacterium]